MAAADAGLFDSTDDEEEFLGFREEDIPVRVDENDEDLSGVVIYHSVRAVTKKAVRNQTMNCLKTTHGVAICEMFM